jgi:DNA mismatch repair protein MutL
MAIQLLKDDLINKIAAGEVIERPASIVKELIENSIDAGAKKIKVRISGGGIQEIEVEDNGKGLLFEEVELAFLRHATSKISKEEDLQHILTMGFRGEALPSIASVSRIELFSKAGPEPGVYYSLNAGQAIEHRVASTPAGTRIIVKDLFFNTPARKKFLKSVITESNHIYETLIKYALARPDISFSYSSEKKHYFKTPGNGSLMDAVVAIYGRDFTQHLITVDYEGTDYSISGLISTPEIKRVNRKNQLFFVNSRPIRSPLLYRAVDLAYQGRLVSREYPIVILLIKLNPSLIDVNVHPQKSEVRFQDEKTVLRLVTEVIKERLEHRNYSVNLNYFNNEYAAAIDITSGPDGSQQTELLQDSFPAGEMINNHNFAFNQLNNTSGQAVEPQFIAEISQPDSTAPAAFRIIGQIFNTYILLEKDDALWIADQHAAHEKIIFSQLLNNYYQSEPVIQNLLLPITMELSARQINLIEKNLDWLTGLGFDIQIIGHSSIALRAIPVHAAGHEQDIVFEILDNLADNKNSVLEFTRSALAIMACRKAVKSGQALKLEEMQNIIHDLFQTKDYQHCPHGRPTIIGLSADDLGKMFKRL